MNNKKQKTSNFRYIFIISLGTLAIIASIVFVSWGKINISWFTGISIVGGIFIIVGALANEKYKKNQEVLNYLNAGIYINQEAKIHRIIGTQKANQDNKDFETWSEYILNKVYILNTPNYKKELYKCLLRERKDCQASSDMMKTIVLPGELGLVTAFKDSFPNGYDLVGVFILTFVVIILIVIEVTELENRIAFIDDFIEAIDIYEKEQKEAEENKTKSVMSNN